MCSDVPVRKETLHHYCCIDGRVSTAEIRVATIKLGYKELKPSQEA